MINRLRDDHGLKQTRDTRQVNKTQDVGLELGPEKGH